MGWQPIESAPKDGSWLIVTSTWNKYARACVQCDGGVFYRDDDKSVNIDLYTHWMPMPEPPSAETNAPAASE